MHAESQVVPGVGRGFLSFGREVVWSEKRIGISQLEKFLEDRRNTYQSEALAQHIEIVIIGGQDDERGRHVYQKCIHAGADCIDPYADILLEGCHLR